jgi:hypothetical protein
LCRLRVLATRHRQQQHAHENQRCLFHPTIIVRSGPGLL